MTELNLSASSLSTHQQAVESKRKLPRTVRVIFAALLSLLFPGMGQLYAQRIWRGVVIALSVIALDALSLGFHLFLTFAGSVVALVVTLSWRLCIVGDAMHLTWMYNDAKREPRNWSKTLGALAIIFVLVGYPVPDYLRNRMLNYFRAYKISSGSMCPTLCEGERMVADPSAYDSLLPARGELLIFDFNHSGTIFPKRVIGVAGDVVSRGPANTILVNHVPVTLPPPCGKNESFNKLVAEGPPFETIRVPEGSLFVLGDSLDNSYDSRFFGVIPLDEVRGKPKFIYWSHNRSRIGCNLR